MTLSTLAPPYFDDFDANKNYLQVLFKPGYALQSRELNQIQTSLQNQIDKFGKHIFKNGSVVLNGKSSLTNFQYINIKSTNVLDSTNIDNTVITGLTSGAKGKTYLIELGESSTYILYYQSINNIEFQQNEIIRATDLTLYEIIDDRYYTGSRKVFTVEPGVFFVNGYFVYSEYQSTSVLNDCRVGLQINENVITAFTNDDLLDPAQGSYNYAAPGADRYTIELTLTTKPLVKIEDETVSNELLVEDNFIQLARIENGGIVSQLTHASYADLEVNLARRTYDESGDYTVKAFGLKIKPHLYGDNNKLTVAIDPGKGYIRGYEFETLSTQYLTLDKARDVADVNNSIIDLGFGSYVYIDPPVSGTNALDYSSNTSINIYSLENGLGSLIGTANVDSISLHNSTPTVVYKLALFNVELNQGYTFKDAKSLVKTGWMANIALTSYPDISLTNDPDYDVSLISAPSKCYITPIPNSPVHTLLTRPNDTSDTEYQIYKKFTGTFFYNTFEEYYEVNISVTDPHENFVGNNPTDYLIVKSDGVIINPLNVSGSSNSKTLIVGSDIGAVNIYTVIGITGAIQRIKSLQTVSKSNIVIRNTNKELITTKISLGYADCYFKQNADKTYDNIQVIAKNSLDNTITPENVTNAFDYNNGQKDDLYDHGWMQLKTGFKIPSQFDVVDVTFEYFSHSSSNGFLSVDSYSLDYTEIPTYISAKGEVFKLHSCLDFRPVRQPNVTTIGGSYSIIPNTTISIEYNYYLPRIDKLILTKERKFNIIKGVPADTPRYPEDINDAMTLYIINVPAYTASEKSISFTYVDNRRYTMRDIGKIDKRVGRLEYYTTLSYLEKQASDELIPSDTPGIDRFKNGILVDSFSGHSVGNPGHPDYACSIDKENHILRPRFASHSFLYEPNELIDVVQENDLIHLPYDQVVHTENPYATTWLNANPYMVFQWNGILTLNPATDNWVDTQKLPDVTINMNGENDVYTILNQSSENTNSTGVVWDDWRTVVKGAVTDIDDKYNVQSNQSSNYDPDTGGQYVTNTSVITNTRTITTSDSSIRTGIDVLKSSNKTITRDIGSKIVDTSVIPYVRSRIVDFAAVHMKPNSVIYVTLDGADVSMYCTMGTRLVISGLTTNISLNQMTKVRNVTTVGNVTITKLATVLLGTDNKVFVKVDGSSNGIFEVGDTLSWFDNNSWINGGVIDSIDNYSELQTDDSGLIAGSLLIPDPNVDLNPKFRTGELLFRLSDTKSINPTTAAETKYVTQGLSQSSERTLMATRIATATIKPVSGVVNTGYTNTQNIVIPPISSTVLIPPGAPPHTVSCGGVLYSDGRQGVWQYIVDFGTDINEVDPTKNIVGIKIDVSKNNKPVKYSLIWNGQTFTTGFVGNDVNPDSDKSYSDNLISKGLTPIKQNAVSELSFLKNVANPRTAFLKIETPIAGADWAVEVFCSEPEPPKPTYSIAPDKYIVEEGGVVTFTVLTTDVAENTVLWWTLNEDDSTITADDFAAGDQNTDGQIIVNKLGVMVFTKHIAVDAVSDPNEVFSLDLRLANSTGTIVAGCSSITIIDTTIIPEPTYDIQVDKTNVYEGDIVICTVTTTNVDNGTPLYWDIDPAYGTVTVPDDFVNISGTIIISEGVAVFSLAIATDILDENPDEYFRVRLKTDDVTVVDNTCRVNIIDVETPTYSIVPRNRIIYEGETAVFDIYVTNLDPVTPLYWGTDLLNSAEADDFVGSVITGTIDIEGTTSASTDVLSYATDINAATEGDEYFGVNLYTDSNRTVLVASSASVTIKELLEPTYAIYPLYTRVNEGDVIPYTITTSNVPDNTTLYWKIITVDQTPSDPRTTVSYADFKTGQSGTSGSVVINNNNSGLELYTVLDINVENNEIVTVYLYTDSGFTTKVATAATVTIVDAIIPAQYDIRATLSPIGVIRTRLSSLYNLVFPNAHVINNKYIQ